jgi:hypothetical protein
MNYQQAKNLRKGDEIELKKGGKRIVERVVVTEGSSWVVIHTTQREEFYHHEVL